MGTHSMCKWSWYQAGKYQAGKTLGTGHLVGTLHLPVTARYAASKDCARKEGGGSKVRDNLTGHLVVVHGLTLERLPMDPFDCAPFDTFEYGAAGVLGAEVLFMRI